MFRLYDTRRGQAEPVRPARRGQLRICACGPAADGCAHLGDLRSCLLADLIRRNAERHHLTVIVCQNIADVGRPGDDSQIEPGGRPALPARSGEDSFRADCMTLGIRPPDYSPRASASVALATDLCGQLIAAGHAYPTAAGSVYFDARSFPGYGELCGRPGDLPPARPAGGAQDGQRGLADWPLWRGVPAGREVTWPAPWGSGVPHRDASCSAMALHYLGQRIDVHTGGIDLCLPHHEHVRAQSDSAAGGEVVGHWAHGGQLLAGGRAMAGTNGNVVVLADLARRGLDPLALRLACLQHRYRQPMNLSWDSLAAADGALRRWRERVAAWAASPSRPMCAEYSARIAAAFDDDLDTPAALRTLRALELDPAIPAGSKFESFAHADQMLALDLTSDIGRAGGSAPGAQ